MLAEPQLPGDSNNSEQTAVTSTSDITGGSLDYLVANAAYMTEWDVYEPIGAL